MHFKMLSCILLDSIDSCTHPPSQVDQSLKSVCRSRSPEVWLVSSVVSARPSPSKSRVVELLTPYCAYKSLGIMLQMQIPTQQVWNGAQDSLASTKPLGDGDANAAGPQTTLSTRAL